MLKTASITAMLALALAMTTGRLGFAQAGDKKAELPKADRDGWISLFNGKDLTGWDGDPKIWRVENGCISGKAAKVSHNTFLIYNHPFADFELTAKCMLIKGGGFTNSGIQYRSKVIDPKEWIVGGYQADMGQGYWGTLYEERGRGGLGKKMEGAQDPKDGEWADSASLPTATIWSTTSTASRRWTWSIPTRRRRPRKGSSPCNTTPPAWTSRFASGTCGSRFSIARARSNRSGWGGESEDDGLVAPFATKTLPETIPEVRLCTALLACSNPTAILA